MKTERARDVLWAICWGLDCRSKLGRRLRTAGLRRVLVAVLIQCDISEKRIRFDHCIAWYQFIPVMYQASVSASNFIQVLTLCKR